MPQQSKRQNWGQAHRVLPKLDLIELQTSSYQDFLDKGIRQALDEVNGDGGIQDFTGKKLVSQFWRLSLWSGQIHSFSS